MKFPAYIWKDEQVVEFISGAANFLNAEMIEGNGFLNCPIYDPNEESRKYRIGKLQTRNERWSPMEFRDLPPRFQIHLTLLGYS